MNTNFFLVTTNLKDVCQHFVLFNIHNELMQKNVKRLGKCRGIFSPSKITKQKKQKGLQVNAAHNNNYFLHIYIIMALLFLNWPKWKNHIETYVST